MPGVQEFLPTATLVLLAVATVLLLILVLRRPPDLVEALQLLTREQIDGNRRLERALIEHVAARSREQREELSVSLDRFATGQLKQLAQLTAANDQRLAEVRATLEQRLRELQLDNARRLEEMRSTVDEKLHATLEQRLGESFRQVSERLEQVHRGLGEMRVLASDVGDLKRVLTNVKTRGTWGEIQLAALLEQMLVPDQYQANVATVPGATQRVEFAIRLPGAGADSPV